MNLKPAMSILGLGFFVAACPTSVLGQGVGGVYDLQVCRGPCEVKGNEYLTGTLTLLPAAMKDGKGQPLQVGPDHINGCYILTRGRPQDDSYAGLQPRGYLSWNYRFSDSSLTFALYRTADASYDVELKPAAGGFAGAGVSWGARAPKISAPRDTVLATRRKSAGPAECPPPKISPARSDAAPR